MDMNLSKEHLMVKQLIHDFAINEIEPWAEETDEFTAFPGKLFTRCKPMVLWVSLSEKSEDRVATQWRIFWLLKKLQKFAQPLR